MRVERRKMSTRPVTPSACAALPWGHWLALALPTFALCAAAVLADSGTERWAELEAKVDTTGFSAAFVDSLRAAYDVPRGAPLRQIPSTSFDQPEKIVLEAKWGPFRAGYAIMHSARDSAAGIGRASVIAVTTRVTSRLFKVKDFVRTTIDLPGLYPLFFEEHIEEGRYRAARWVLYDQPDTTIFSNKRNKERVNAPLFTYDYLSLFHYLRSRTLAPGDTFSLSCYVQGKVHEVFFRCGERERVRTDVGDFDCIALEPRFVAEGRNFSRRDRVHLWLTDDPLHMLVKIRAKLKVGSVDGELIYYRRGEEVRSRPDD